MTEELRVLARPAMQCSWKVVIVLALVAITIQYTAIRTLTYKPGGCEDYPHFSFNTSSKTHILLLTTTRSGSTFLGELLNQHQEVFYLFEPLYHVQATLAADSRQFMLGAFRDLLRSLYSCDLYSLERFIKPAPTNHITNALFRRSASRALCSQPVCEAFGPTNVYVKAGDCYKKCAALNFTLAVEACQDQQHVVIKTVRVPEIGDVQSLVEDPRLNLKVIQLVRDPRAILSSRIDTFRGTYHLWRKWRDTGKRPENLGSSAITMVCEDFLGSVSTGLSHPHWLREKYMLVRYEDLARNPLLKTKEIYDYLGLSMDKHVQNWIQANTKGSNGSSDRSQYGTLRDSAAKVESWRLKLSYDMVEYTQIQCQKILHQLGYKAVTSVEELKNMSISLVQDI